MNCKKHVQVLSLMVLSAAWAFWLVSGHDSVYKMEADEIRIKDNSTGKATKCHPNDTTQAYVSWTPNELSPSGQVQITFSYAAPHDMNGGFVNISLYFQGESSPFIGFSAKFTCDDILPYLPKCPLRKRSKFGITKNITNLHPLTSFPGDYNAIIDVRNEKNEEMVCLNFTLHVKEL